MNFIFLIAIRMLLHLTIGFCCILLVKTLLLLCENIDFVEVEAGEFSKSFAIFEKVCEEIIFQHVFDCLLKIQNEDFKTRIISLENK